MIRVGGLAGQTRHTVCDNECLHGNDLSPDYDGVSEHHLPWRYVFPHHKRDFSVTNQPLKPKLGGAGDASH